MSSTSAQQKESQAWSDKGKVAYTSGNLKEALNCYNKAIEIEPTKSMFFSNRARVNMNLCNLEVAFKDSEKATELDKSNIKGHLLNGQIIALMCQKSHSDLHLLATCIERLTKALTLCAGQKMQQNEQYLKDNIRRVKKLQWFLLREQEQKKDAVIISQIIDRINKQPNESAEAKKKQIELINSTLNADAKPLMIPDYYRCQLTKKMLSDPVTTKFSNTFERKELSNYFQHQKQQRDPIALQPLPDASTDVVTNINLKKAIEEYLDLNPWAFEFQENQTIEDLKF